MQKYKRGKNIKTNKFGLSDISEKSTLYYDEDTSGMASLYKRQLDWKNIEFSKSEQIQLKKLDEYCEQEGNHSIEFLKIDVEGNEYKVLQGAQRMLANNAINIIQIEFGGCNIDSRIFFRDFWNILHEKYKFYRIVCDGLRPIDEYLETNELFTCTNYLIVRKTLVM